ncbi:cilia- and flagella-associated protein 119 [Salarias fasciatus]|uniref:cilia- and flagella-associated protein 119 n=1 Tax=Salarias fasciatus TaxID=181472 RepID=UPI001176604B|nr:coiled-coil domain-containing protein 189 [Salarias fasciatus]
MDTNIKAPQVLKAKLMLWTDVSYHDMDEIDKMQSIPDLESVLTSVFAVDLPEPKRGVLLELYVQAVLFCREHHFRKEQTSALLSILKSIHEANVGTPLDNIEACFRHCRELLLCHSVRRPPFSINLFSFEEVNWVLKYIHSSYMRHYKLYRYVFTPQVQLDLSVTYSAGLTEEKTSITNDSSLSDGSTEAHEASVTGSPSELKALIEQEVRQQMALVSGQLDQRMKEMAFQHNNTSDSSQSNHKTKK